MKKLFNWMVGIAEPLPSDKSQHSETGLRLAAVVYFFSMVIPGAIFNDIRLASKIAMGFMVALMVLFFAYEVYQKVTKSGEFDLKDFTVAARFPFLLLCVTGFFLLMI